MSTHSVRRHGQQAPLEQASPPRTKITPAAAARLLARAAALPSAQEAEARPHAGLLPEVDAAAARGKLIKTRPTSVQEAFKAASAFLEARKQQERGPPLTPEEQTWWLHLLNKVRGYDALASFETRDKCFKDERSHGRIKRLWKVMDQVRELDRATAEQERERLPPGTAFNFPDRMLDVTAAAERSLQKPERPKEPPAHRVLTADEVARVEGRGTDSYGLGPGTLWIGQSHGAYSPGIGRDFVPRPDGMMVAVKTR